MNDEDLYQDDFLDENQTNNVNRGQYLWKKAKFWWMKNIVHGTVGNSMERIGVPLYDLTEDGHRIDNSDEDILETPMFLGDRAMKHQANIKRLKYITFIATVIGLLVFLIIKVFDSDPDRFDHHQNMHNFLQSSTFNPNVRYNNGTTDFYPINIVLKIDGLHVNSIIANDNNSMPLLNKLYQGNIGNSKLLVNSSTFVAQEGMIPVFPLSNDAIIWSMMTGLTPGKHGVFYDGDNCTNVIETKKRKQFRPIWRQLETKFQNFKVAMDSYFVSNHGNHTPSYYLERSNSKDKKQKNRKTKISDSDTIEWILNLIDNKDITERPQLFLTSFTNYADKMYCKGSQDQNSELYKIDILITKLLLNLQRRNLMTFTNIIIVSDFGLSQEPVPYDNILSLNQLLDDDPSTGKDIQDKLIESLDIDDNMLSIYVRNKNKNEIYNHLLGGPYNEHFQIELKGDLQSDWYSASHSINTIDDMGDILVIPNAGYGFKENNKDKMPGKHRNKEFKLKKDKEYLLGGYPYNYNNDTDFKIDPNDKHGGPSIFIGIGPIFSVPDDNSNNGVGTVQIVNKRMKNQSVYEIIAEACGLSYKDRNVESLSMNSNEDDITIKHVTFTEFANDDKIPEITEVEIDEIQDEEEEEEDTDDDTNNHNSNLVTIAKSTLLTTSRSSLVPVETGLFNGEKTSITTRTTPTMSTSRAVSTSTNKAGSSFDQIISDGKDVIDEIFQWLQDSLNDL
ncbi:hypothetical protein C6P45_000896 [Maudiozyma exigua]|uniref:Uncharacterized protein n=1 Tax=Maudiozyma exigua TaxID=34358 RepID=A0A9P6W5P8_MAUEX|nr:hypothetical protein C6P45_000896 [Kazachstania exigua]